MVTARDHDPSGDWRKELLKSFTDKKIWQRGIQLGTKSVV
jgi:hypothetical protein